MSEELFTTIFNYVYVPFIAALLLVLAYVYRSDEKTNDNVTVLDDKLDQHINEFTLFRAEQINQTSVLKEINENVASNNIIAARTDERMKAVEATIERRSEVRSNNLTL